MINQPKGVVTINIDGDLGDAPSDASLVKLVPQIKKELRASQGAMDAFVVFIRALTVPIEGGKTDGFTPRFRGVSTNIVFLRSDTLPDARTMSHEFGHALGLEHDFVDEGNLMARAVNLNISQKSLNRGRILFANQMAVLFDLDPIGDGQ